MNEKIQCGLCAFGMSGRVFHAPLIQAHPDFRLHGVLERKHRDAELLYPEVVTYPTYEKMLADENLNLVIVNVPDHLHRDFVEDALEAGKHVIVEKPFTLRVTDAEQLTALAAKKQLGLFVFQNRRWDSDFLTVKKVLEEKRVGRLVEFEAHYDRYRPVPPENTWKEDRNYGPGLLYNLGSHLIDQALVLFGMPNEVFADLDKMRRLGKVSDYFHLILFYPGHRVILKSSYLVPKPAFKYLLHGETGTFIKSGQDPQEQRLTEGWAADDPMIGQEPEEDQGILYEAGQPSGEKILSEKGNYLQFYTDVAAELHGAKGQAVSAKAGLQVIRVIEAAKKSNDSGERVKLL